MERSQHHQGARSAIGVLLVLLGGLAVAAPAAALPTATSIGSDHTQRYAFVSPDRRVGLLATDGRALGSAAIPAITEEESCCRPPRVLGVVDGGAVIGVTRKPSPTSVPPINDPLGYYRPDLGFTWLCGMPETQRCPQRGPRFGSGDLLAVGRHWGWIQQDQAEDGVAEWPIRFRIRDGQLRWRAPTRQEERRVPEPYYDSPGPLPSQFSEAIAPFSLDGGQLRRLQPWGYSARAHQYGALVLRRRGDAPEEAARVLNYQDQTVSGGSDYNPGIAYGSRGVVWTTGKLLGFWDARSRTVWRRRAPTSRLDTKAVFVDTAGDSLLLGFGDFSFQETVARLQVSRLPDAKHTRGWSALRRQLRRGDRLSFR